MLDRPIQMDLEGVPGLSLEEVGTHKLSGAEGCFALPSVARAADQVRQLPHHDSDRQPGNCGRCGQGPFLFTCDQSSLASLGCIVLHAELVPAGCLGRHFREPSGPGLSSL